MSLFSGSSLQYSLQRQSQQFPIGWRGREEQCLKREVRVAMHQIGSPTAPSICVGGYMTTKLECPVTLSSLSPPRQVKAVWVWSRSDPLLLEEQPSRFGRPPMSRLRTVMSSEFRVCKFPQSIFRTGGEDRMDIELMWKALGSWYKIFDSHLKTVRSRAVGLVCGAKREIQRSFSSCWQQV